MTDIKGTNIASAITPFTTDDLYPTHYAKYGCGGWREVDTIAERDAIPEKRRSVGMVVAVQEDGKNYQLQADSTWKELQRPNIELNNPYSLFDSKYSDHELNNLSWLKSEGQWNAKATYPTVYEGLQVEYNSEIATGTTVTLPSGVSYTKHGLSVKLSTEEYTDYDFRLNTTDETFMLPLLDGSESLPSDRYIALELQASESTYTYTAPANGWFICNWASEDNTVTNPYIAVKQFGCPIEQRFQRSNLSDNKVGRLSMIAPLSKGNYTVTYRDCSNYSMKDTYFIYARGNGSLYFYVGETVQNANLIDAGKIGEQLANKQDKYTTITTLATSGTINLVDNTFNRIAVEGATTFVLPTVVDNTIFHEIFIQLSMATVQTIDLGTTWFFNKKQPDLSSAGYYNLVYEYDGTHWVVSAINKGEVA